MGSAEGGDAGGESRSQGKESRAEYWAKSLTAIVFFAEVAIIAGVYCQTAQLKSSEGETQELLVSLREEVAALHHFYRSEMAKLSREAVCPPCPSLQQRMEEVLREIHGDFEKTAVKLEANISTLYNTINLHAKKITGLAEKAQNSPLLKLLQNM